MSQLITLHNNVPTVSHRVIAERTENQDLSVKRLIDNHKEDFEEFGLIRFEIEKGNGRPKEDYLLNEQQSTLLLTYLKNTLAVRAFKVALVKEFYKLREELYHKKNDIVITCTTDKEKLGTLETQLYMLKNENRELRRAMNRMTYNDNHLPKAEGIKAGEYKRLFGKKDLVTVVKVEEGYVHLIGGDGYGKVNVVDFEKFFTKAQKLLK